MQNLRTDIDMAALGALMSKLDAESRDALYPLFVEGFIDGPIADITFEDEELNQLFAAVWLPVRRRRSQDPEFWAEVEAMERRFAAVPFGLVTKLSVPDAAAVVMRQRPAEPNEIVLLVESLATAELLEAALLILYEDRDKNDRVSSHTSVFLPAAEFEGALLGGSSNRKEDSPLVGLDRELEKARRAQEIDLAGIGLTRLAWYDPLAEYRGSFPVWDPRWVPKAP